MTSAPEPAEPAATDIPPELLPRKRRLLPVFAALGALAVVGGFFAVRSLREPDPLRVVIAVDLDGHFWDGSRGSAKLVNELAERLDAIGFEPVRAGDPAILEVLKESESPLAAARALRASFVISAKVAPEIIQHPVEGGYTEVRADAPIEVRYVGDELGQEGRLVTWAGGKLKDDAMRRLGEGLALQAFDQVVPHLVEHPSIKAIFDGNDIKLADQVAKAKKYVEARATRLSEANRTYEDLEKRRREHDKGPAKVTYLSSIRSADALGGVSQLGALVHSSDVTPFVAPRTTKLGWITGLEQLEWRSPGKEPKRVWSGYHLFSYPAASPDGSRLLFVEDLFGWAKTLTVVDPDGKHRRLRVDPEHRFSSPKVAPGGKVASLYDRPCRDCQGSLVVVSLDDGKNLFERAGKDGFVSGTAWLDDHRLAYLFTPAADPEQSEKAPVQAIRVVDVAAAPPSDALVVSVPEGLELESLTPSRDGKLLAAEIDGGTKALALIDVAAGKLEPIDAGGIVENPSFSPDGKLLTFTSGGDVYLFDLESKSVRELTNNPWSERYPLFSEDGTRIFFESRSDDPNYERRSLSLIGSVAVQDAGKPLPKAR